CEDILHHVYSFPTRRSSDVLLFKIGLNGFFRHVATVVDIIIFTDQTSNLNFFRLCIVLVNSVITNMRIGRHHNLPVIGWVCENFLVTGCPCIKTDFACSCTDFSSGLTVINRSIFKHQNGWQLAAVGDRLTALPSLPFSLPTLLHLPTHPTPYHLNSLPSPHTSTFNAPDLETRHATSL